MPPSTASLPPALVAAALERWIAALNGRGDRAATEAALAPEVCIERHAPAPRAALGTGAPLEVFTGYDEVGRWLARSPQEAVFALASAARINGALVEVDYSITAGDFHNGGKWRVRLDGERLAWIAHHPAALET